MILLNQSAFKKSTVCFFVNFSQRIYYFYTHIQESKFHGDGKYGRNLVKVDKCHESKNPFSIVEAINVKELICSKGWQNRWFVLESDNSLLSYYTVSNHDYN